jgi:addiction module RelE/StbE family toxin
MPFILNKRFKKAFLRQPNKIQEKFIERMRLFVADPFDQQLRNHALSGKYIGLRSIDITGDIRAVYELINDTAVFITIGTHTQLYK